MLIRSFLISAQGQEEDCYCNYEKRISSL